MDTVDLCENVQRRSCIWERVPDQLVPILQNRSGKRRGCEWKMWALRNRCYKEKSASVDAAYHKICRPSFERSRQTGLAGKSKENAGWLDRKILRCRSRFPGGWKRRQDHRLYNTSGYLTRCNIHGTCAGTCTCKRTCDRRDKRSGGAVYLWCFHEVQRRPYAG